MNPKPSVSSRSPQPTTQVTSRGNLYAAWKNTRSRWRTTNRIIRLAAQWWRLRISQPKLTSLVMNWTLSYAASGVGL